MEQQEIEVYRRFEELGAASEFHDPYENDPEKAKMIADHILWLKSIRHQRPLSSAYFRIGVYIRYFNQTKYENYLNYHKKQFSDTIALCPAWTLVDFYIDNGSSSSTPYMENSESLSRLLNDCMDGKIDLIITQKISNMSKDPQELSFTARMLASLPHPVGIYFISEDVFTLATYYLDDLRDTEFLPGSGVKQIENNENGGLTNA